MAVSVYIPTPYRPQADGATRVEVAATSVQALLTELAGRYPRLAERILDANGHLPGYLNVYVNQVEVRALEGEATALRDGDEVALIPAMAGGSGPEALVSSVPLPSAPGTAPSPSPSPSPAPAPAPSPSLARAPSPSLAPSPSPAPAPAPGPLLDREQLERYSRHIRLDEVGVVGQRRLLDSRVLLIGAGALGSPAAIYLAAAGVGTLGIVDGDRVDLSNLQRQILHFNHDVGRPKAQSARRHLEDINPHLHVVTYPTVIDSTNALEIVRDFDLVVNGSDNFPTRYLINDTCVLLGKPLVDASILKWEGQATVFLPGRGCYRCLFPAPPPPGSVPSCAEGGVMGALSGVMGALEAVEAIKVLLGRGDPLAGRLILYDALAGEFQTLRWRRNPECPVCGDHPTIHALIDYEGFCGVPDPSHDGRHEPAGDAVGPAASAPGAAGAAPAAADGAADPIELSPLEAQRRMAAGALLVDVREGHELAAARIPGAEPLPYSVLAARAAEVLDPAQEMIFVCRIGQRSRIAVEMLRRAGFPRTYNLRDGMVGWINEGLPLEEPAATEGQ